MAKEVSIGTLTVGKILLLIIVLIAISIFAVLVWYPLGYILNDGFLEGIAGGFGRIAADVLLIVYVAIICIGTWILLLLYILYKLINPIFVVNIPIFGPIISEILLNITPFKEVRETGVVSFFDGIIDTAKSSEKIGSKINGFFKQIFGFLLTSTRKGKQEFIQDKPKDTKQSKKPSTNSSELKNINSCARKQFIINRYDECIDKNVKNISSTVGSFDRIKMESANTSGKLKCDMEKIKRITCMIQQEQDEENGKRIKSCK